MATKATDSVDRVRTAAHRSSLEVSPEDLLEALSIKLGPKLVAYVVDRDESTISRWKAGKSTPGEGALLPLRQCYQIFKLLERKDADPTVRAWFIGTNPQLDDGTPIDAIRDGKYRETLAAARAFAAGA